MNLYIQVICCHYEVHLQTPIYKVICKSWNSLVKLNCEACKRTFHYLYKSNSNENCQKWDVKCHFVTLNSVLILINSVFAIMVSVKMGRYFNNSIFFIKKYN